MVTTTSSIGFLTLSIVTLVLMLVGSTQSLRPYHFTYHRKGTNMENQIKEERKGELGMELYPTGSSLPDCSHACGPCFPCKRVMVSFECSIAESCPIVYRCMCRGKYYHVPSN
ncbi:protein EPIDERMAL PATTERNING FACTOR 2-like [Nicotiana tabacum]|uniref:Epidermal patterning factor-like protein n=1 Tax=Nicotiana tabacum TaxID=4097 RepID=A0A1S4BCX5_TOBAC